MCINGHIWVHRCVTLVLAKSPSNSKTYVSATLPPLSLELARWLLGW